MKISKIKVELLLFVMLSFLSTNTNSQTFLPNSVFGNGVANSANDSLNMVGTLGQAVIGVTNNESLVKNIGFWYSSNGLVTSVENVTDFIPENYQLAQNYPNPFNPSTTIEFALPKSSHVTLRIYNIIGVEIITLIDREHQPGRFEIIWDASGMPSGLYVYRLQADDFVHQKKMILIK